MTAIFMATSLYKSRTTRRRRRARAAEREKIVTMDVEAIVARIWPGERRRSRCSAAASPSHNFKVDGRRWCRTSCALAGRGHGAARYRPFRRVRGGARRGRGRGRPRGGHVRRARGVPRDAVHRGRRSCRSSGCGSPTRSRGSRRRSARCTAARRCRRASSRFASSRTTARSRSAHGAEVPPSYAWARQVARRVERARGAVPGAAVPQRPAQRELHRRRHADPDRRLGVRGDGGRLLRPRELLDQQRCSAARSGARCSRRTSGRCARPTSGHSS